MDGDGSPVAGWHCPPRHCPAEDDVEPARQRRNAYRCSATNCAHVRRGDLLWSFLAAIVRAVFFFHPLAVAERRLRLRKRSPPMSSPSSCRRQDPVSYAALLVSWSVSSVRLAVLPTMSVGVAGSHASLKQRLLAMRFMKPLSCRSSSLTASCWRWSPGSVSCPGRWLRPRRRQRSRASHADKVGGRRTRQTGAAGQDRTRPICLVQGRHADDPAQLRRLDRDEIVDNTTIFVWNNATDKYQPATAAQTLDRVEAQHLDHGLFFPGPGHAPLRIAQGSDRGHVRLVQGRPPAHPRQKPRRELRQEVRQ